jgi:hypothetical protein
MGQLIDAARRSLSGHRSQLALPVASSAAHAGGAAQAIGRRWNQVLHKKHIKEQIDKSLLSC